jgi:flagellar basal-body rod protein FlgG
MIRSLWVAKTGLDTQQASLDTIANNLANSQTTAYKKSRPVFEDLIYQTLRGAGLNEETGRLLTTGLQAGTGARVAFTQRIHSEGALLRSDNPLDVAISGAGFFMVEGANGETAYTRAGNFMRNSDGYIVNAAGFPVLSSGGAPIAIPSNASSVVIGVDGTVTYYTGSTTIAFDAGQIGVVNFVNPAGLAAAGGNLYYETISSGTPQLGVAGQDGYGSITQYYTEQSNVNIAEELVSLIAAQRAYEVSTRAVSASDQMLQRLGQL